MQTLVDIDLAKFEERLLGHLYGKYTSKYFKEILYAITYGASYPRLLKHNRVKSIRRTKMYIKHCKSLTLWSI